MPTDLKDVIAELSAIKRLLVFALTREGASQREIATALGVNQSSVSRMMARKAGKVPGTGSEEDEEGANGKL